MHVYLGAPVPRELGERRDVPMHLAVHVEALGDIAPHQLEAAVEVSLPSTPLTFDVVQL